ncbi:hypothetical protein CWB99_21625 [Pseudoalteromonas rubra]|uniref:Uncharacterized protein n=1 Tax=Pseudoalteromonas rubra TaxID=43658 RepID=A0A5S3WFJ5_9GAMM|nr:hypothetical protein CWB99_21625 [Pseudoalteromonas rubra]TMP36312.1 hypothetical protein CWC00_02400 [Pseudoalteromonas rubra]
MKVSIDHSNKKLSKRLRYNQQDSAMRLSKINDLNRPCFREINITRQMAELIKKTRKQMNLNGAEQNTLLYYVK